MMRSLSHIIFVLAYTMGVLFLWIFVPVYVIVKTEMEQRKMGDI